MEKSMGTVVICIALFFILLPVQRLLAGYIFKTTDILKELKGIKESLEKQQDVTLNRIKESLEKK